MKYFSNRRSKLIIKLSYDFGSGPRYVNKSERMLI